MNLFNLGTVNGTHHLKGTIKVKSGFENVELIENQKLIAELKNKDKKILTVESIRTLNAKTILIDFEEIKTKTDALKYMGASLLIRRDLLGDLDNENFYLVDLIGLSCVEENGNILGDITDVFTTAAHDIYVVNEGKEEIMIPAVDEFIKKIDFYNKKIIVSIPEQLKNI